MMALSMLLFRLLIANVLTEISSSPPKDLPDRGVEPVPNCSDDFNDIEKNQITQGFRDAQDLAAAAYEAVKFPCAYLTYLHQHYISLQMTTRFT